MEAVAPPAADDPVTMLLAASSDRFAVDGHGALASMTDELAGYISDLSRQAGTRAGRAERGQRPPCQPLEPDTRTPQRPAPASASLVRPVVRGNPPSVSARDPPSGRAAAARTNCSARIPLPGPPPNSSRQSRILQAMSSMVVLKPRSSPCPRRAIPAISETGCSARSTATESLASKPGNAWRRWTLRADRRPPPLPGPVPGQGYRASSPRPARPQ